jgi:hypothetical protein
VTEADYGQYGCRADNPLGSDYAFISLRQGGGLRLEGGLLYAVVGITGGLVIIIVLVTAVACVRRYRRQRSAGSRAEQQLNNEPPILKRNAANTKNINEMVAGGGGTTYRHLAPDLLDSVSLLSGRGVRDPLLPQLSPTDWPNGSGAIPHGGGSHQLNSPLPAFAGYYGNVQLTARHLREEREDDQLSRSSSQSTLPPAAQASGGGRRPSRRSPSPQYMSDAAVDYSTSSTMSSVLSRGSRSNR